MLTVKHDQGHDQLHLVFRDDRIIVDREWCALNAVVSLAADGEVIEITVMNYYSDPQWLFTPEFVERYKLGEQADDLRLVFQAFFAPPNLAVKAIKYEGPDGGEIVIPAPAPKN